ncbi:MAG: phosphoribosyltransferase family protein [Pseudomonadota bacterium]
MNYRSIADLSALIRANLHRVPVEVDVVAGVPRSGLLAASMIALGLNRPLTDIDGLCAGRELVGGQTRITGMSRPRGHPEEWKVVLVVDDSVASGGSMRRAREQIVAARLPFQIIYCAAYVTRSTRDQVDLHFEVVGMPRMFEWNVMHHPLLKTCCVDFDGVLCCDPSEDENDDGEYYRKFLLNATPRFVATQRIGWIVTSRLEKYRTESLEWLRRHKVEFDNLVMLDLPDARTRRRLGVHAAFKADVFRNCGAELFIESESGQAMDIARLSGKHALCIETQCLYSPDLTSITAATAQGSIFARRAAAKLRRTWHRVIGG